MSPEFMHGDPKILRYLHTQVLIYENRVLVAEMLQWPIGVLAALAIYGKFGVIAAIFFGAACCYLAAMPERRKLKMPRKNLPLTKHNFPN